MATIAKVVADLRHGSKPGDVRRRLADAIEAMPPNAAKYRVVADITPMGPPPVAENTMDVARYDVHISENQRLMLANAMRQSVIIGKHAGQDTDEMEILQGMLESGMEELPTCNGFTL